MSESKAAATEIYHLAACINTHSWNGDKTQVALCPNNNEIRIYKKDNNQFKLEHVLTEHEGLVTGIDWAPKSNQIVSCSQDRHVYVWHYERYKWKKASWAYPWFTRGCVQCKWNPKEDRFVVTTAEKLVHVCYEENAFCLARRIRGHSIALDAAWHPNGYILATAGNDARCRIVSGFLSFYDKKEEINTASFGNKLPSGTIVNEIEARGWIRCVKWSPSGTYLAFASHDCTLTVVDVSSRPHQVHSLRYNRLPLLDLLWINERSIIGVGYDCTPLLFQRRDEDWVYVMSLDEHLQVHDSGEITEVDATEHDLNRELRTSHQNCITCIQAVTSTAEAVTSFSTSGLDGQLIIWHLDVLEATRGIKF